MRPALLDPLFAPLTALDGIGAKTAELMRKIVPVDTSGREVRVIDLLAVTPTGMIDRRARPGIANAAPGTIVTLDLVVDRHRPSPPGNRSAPYRVFAHDETEDIALTFFHARQPWLERMLPEGAKVTVSGRIEWFNGRASMVHPDHIVASEDAGALPLLEPVYPLTAGLSPKVLARAMSAALERLPPIAEWQHPSIAKTHGFPTFAEALGTLHLPRDPKDGDVAGAAWRRLAYDELLAGQVALALVRARMRRLSGRALYASGERKQRILAALPYRLTASQETALAEIEGDLAKPARMLRLLQGDVGSGKTVVAVLAMAHAVEAGGQAAMMAPTEILARQHFASLAPLAEAAGMTVAILTGREKGRERAALLERIACGAVDIVVGTHAIFQDDVAFRDFALAVIDEQHRFGVHQRLTLTAKGEAPDMLVMTATPIPRTLVLAAFGDMDVSRLPKKPPGRQAIATLTVPDDRLDELVARIARAVAQGRKVYWICPLVEESEDLDLVSAVDRHRRLAEIMGDQAGLIHGRLAGRDKDAAMQAFKDGRTRVLVGTTVIEVGVDVPDATIIVIEHAERFGLAQLHQLRGRVGRGSEASNCILLYKAPLGEIAGRRLAVMRETDDGFRIAEEDLKLRGEGELLGTRQSGAPGFRFVQLEHHGDLMEAARDDARLLLSGDPDLKATRGDAVRALLYLFGRDDAVRLIRAG